MAISTCIFLGSRHIPDCNITSPKNGMTVQQNRHLFLLSFSLACLLIIRTFFKCNIMVSALAIICCSENIFCNAKHVSQPLEQLIYFSLKHISIQCHTEWQLYVPVSTKWQEKAVKYHGCSFSFRLWYPEHELFSTCELALLGLQPGQVQAYLTLPFALGTSTNLLHHLDVSLMSRGTIICCFCSLLSSSHTGSGNAYTTLLGRAWYGWLPSLTCNFNIPLKQADTCKNITEIIVCSHCQ